MVIGVFKSIIAKTGGYDNLVVESNNPMITSTHVNADPHVIIEYGSSKAYETNGNSPGEWIQVKIKNLYVMPTSYRVKTFYCSQGASHMKEWKLLASNNNITWTRLDIKDNSTLNGANKEATFYFRPIKKAFSIFRIVLFKSFHSNYPYRISLSEFDVNGVIRLWSESAKTKRKVFFICLFLFEIIMIK